MRPGYVGTTTNLQIVLNTQRHSYLNQATQKILSCQIFLPKKIPESKISNPLKSYNHARHLKSGVPPPPGMHPACLPPLSFGFRYFLVVLHVKEGPQQVFQDPDLGYLKTANRDFRGKGGVRFGIVILNGIRDLVVCDARFRKCF